MIIDTFNVRCTEIDGVQYLAARDFIMAVCRKDFSQAFEFWKNVKADLEAHCVEFKFPGRGQVKQPVIQLQGALKLLAMLPCTDASRAIASAALAKPDVEILRRTSEIQAKALEERLKIETDALRRELELKAIINCALMLVKAKQDTSLGGVLRDMSINNLSSADIQSIGCIASAKYRAAYGVHPLKRMQKDKNGKEIWVNDYSEEHVPMLREAIREFQERQPVDH